MAELNGRGGWDLTDADIAEIQQASDDRGTEDDMTAWLRAQVEADKAAARVATDGPWVIDGNTIRGTDRAYHGGSEGAVLVVKHTWPQEAAHIVRHDPRDVIADCDAKLRLLADLDAARSRQAAERADYAAWADGECRAERPAFEGPHPNLIPGLELSVRVVASGYRHRDGWQESWGA